MTSTLTRVAIIVVGLCAVAVWTLYNYRSDTVTTPSGLQYEIVVAGVGAAASAGQSVRIHETTTLGNGTLIYSTRTKNTPVTFLLGGKQVIDGVDEGVTGMRVGERRTLVVPPSLSRRSEYPPNTPPDSTLYIDVELLEIVTKPAAPAPGSDSSGAFGVTMHGIGPIQVGMSVAETAGLLGGALSLPEGADSSECNYLRWRGAPPGVSIMVDEKRVARVDVESSAISTSEGARVGDTDARIRSIYVGRISASPHKYSDGQYLTVAPASPTDSAFRLIFEVEGGRVTRYRAGKMPQVEYVEGCS